MTLSSAEFELVAALVREQAAIILEPGKEYLVESRLAGVARIEGYASAQELIAHWRRTKEDRLRARIVEAMTTNETTFFRDAHPFDAIRQTILPDLIARRAAERSLVIWSAACSTGQEPYSIAMVLREIGMPAPGWNVRILATDLSTEVLGRARNGTYTQLEVNRGLPAPYLVKYFRRLNGPAWQINDDIKRMVELTEINLARPWPAMPKPDIVLMRNVLIYFDKSTKGAILNRVRRLMRPDGYLFLGGAETTLHIDDTFERHPVGKTACYRLAQPAAVTISA